MQLLEEARNLWRDNPTHYTVSHFDDHNVESEPAADGRDLQANVTGADYDQSPAWHNVASQLIDVFDVAQVVDALQIGSGNRNRSCPRTTR